MQPDLYWNGMPQNNVCPSCGEPLEPGASFCVMCGAQLGSPAGHDPYSQDGFAAAPATACPVCGEPIEPGASFCVMCGTPLENTSSFDQGDPFGPGVISVDPPMPVPLTPPETGYTPDVVGFSDPYDQPYEDDSQPTVLTIDDIDADDDDPTVRPHLLTLTYQEAREGCHKTVKVDGQSIEVDVPAGVDVNTLLDIPNHGYFDEMTGRRGPLRLTFYLI